MPEGCGFTFLRAQVEAMKGSQLAIAILQYPPGDSDQGSVYGVAVNLLGFKFAVSPTLAELSVKDSRVTYRPLGFALEDRGYLALRWRRTPVNREIVHLTSEVDTHESPSERNHKKCVV